MYIFYIKVWVQRLRGNHLPPWRGPPPGAVGLLLGGPGSILDRLLPDLKNTKKRAHPNTLQNHKNPALLRPRLRFVFLVPFGDHFS